MSEQMQDLEGRAIEGGYFETEEGADVFEKPSKKPSEQEAKRSESYTRRSPGGRFWTSG
jgi:hypothetical protein